MANAILNFHFDFLTPSLREKLGWLLLRVKIVTVGCWDDCDGCWLLMRAMTWASVIMPWRWLEAYALSRPVDSLDNLDKLDNVGNFVALDNFDNFSHLTILTMFTTWAIYALSQPPKVMFAHGFQSTLYCHGYLWPESWCKMLYNLVGLWIWYHAWGSIKKINGITSSRKPVFMSKSSRPFSYILLRLFSPLSDYQIIIVLQILPDCFLPIIKSSVIVTILTFLQKVFLLFFTLNNLSAFPVALLYETTRQTWYLF